MDIKENDYVKGVSMDGKAIEGQISSVLRNFKVAIVKGW